MLRRLTVAIAAVLIGMTPASAQIESGTWAQAAQPFEQDGTTLTGPGADWLSAEMSDVQHVLVGEQHGVDGLARFTAALEAEFEPDALVLEAGSWMGMHIESEGVRDALADAPYSLAFDYNGDLALIEQFQSRTGEVGEVWGVDQEANAIHPFGYIAQTSTRSHARRTARGLHLKAALDGGEYIRTDNFADLARLKRLTVGEFSHFIVEEVEISMAIFTTWRSGQRGQASERREQSMIQLYDIEVGQFEANSHRTPRTLFKMGGAHIMEGETGPNGVMTLGEHVQRRADHEAELQTLHLGVRGYNPVTTPYPIAELIEGERFLLLDTAILRTAIEAGELETLGDEELADIYGYDALIYINPLQRASKSEVQALQADFRTGIYTQLGLSFWPAPFVIIFTLFGLGLIGTRVVRGGGSITGPALTLTGMGAIITVIFTLQILALVSSTPGSAGLGPVAMAYIAPALALVALVDTVWRGRKGERTPWIAGLVWAGLLIWLGMAMHYWNFGSMLA